MGTTPSKEDATWSVAKEIIQEGQSLSFFKYRSQKSSQFQIPNLVQVSAKTWLSNGFLILPSNPCSQESHDERDQSLCVPSIVVPNVPNDKPNTKSSKVVHFFMFMSGSAFFGGKILHFFLIDVNNYDFKHIQRIFVWKNWP
jgi:hypothetical protein